MEAIDGPLPAMCAPSLSGTWNELCKLGTAALTAAHSLKQQFRFQMVLSFLDLFIFLFLF